MSKISILGAGGWGLALALSAVYSGNYVTVWTPFSDEAQTLLRDGEHKRLLPNIKLPKEIVITQDISCVSNSDITVIATPSFAVRETAARLKNLNCGIIVSVAKGIEYDSLLCLSQVILDELPCADVVVLSGPSHAEEVARKMETSLVATGKNRVSAEYVQKAFLSDKLRVYTNDDMLGVELGGALKNVIAVAAGFCDGKGLGDNTRAALITRGLSEMARLGVAMGANQATFAGLTGMGDLIVTCTSVHSRNHRFGELLGRGVSVEDALRTVGTVEGYHAAKTANKLSKKYKVDMPITQLCYGVMYENISVDDAVSQLMTRPMKSETEFGWIKK